jgi:hypothetical protein
MADPDDIQRYSASLWRFIGGPVLRTGLLIAIVIYIYGVTELQNTFVDSLPPLSRLTDPDLKEFMDMYGLDAVMPFVAIIVFATLIYIVDQIIFSVADVLPPKFFTRDTVLAQEVVDDYFIRGLRSRLERVESPDDVHVMVGERLAKLRVEHPDDPDVRWTNILQERVDSAGAWQSALRFYGFTALIVSGVAVYGGHDAGPIVSRLLIALAILAILFVLATWIWLRRYAALVKYRYWTAWRTVQLQEPKTSSTVSEDAPTFPRSGRTERWWGEVNLMRLHEWRRRRNPRATGSLE